MMEKNYRYLVLVSLVVCLLAVMPVSADPATTPLDLTPPAFVTGSSAEAEGGCTPAFNTSDAGISSYVKVAQTINLASAVMAFDQILEWDDTHALGEIYLNNYHTMFKPRVYVDTTGNIVAYYPRATESSALVSWDGISLTSPTIDFTTNNAIRKVCSNTGISFDTIKNNIRYYHFGYTDADKILVFVNANTTGPEITHLFVPASFTQYEASGSLRTATVYVDTVQIKNTEYTAIFNYGSSLQKGQPHSLKLNPWVTGGYNGGAVATVIVYSEV